MKKLILLIIMLIDLLAGCGSQPALQTGSDVAATRHVLDAALVSPTPEPPNLPAATAFTKRWLHKLPCAAPCWEGVTPGMTVTDTLAILQQTPGIVPSSVSTSIWSGSNTGTISWSWQGSDLSNEALYDLDTTPQVVSVIRPYFEYVPNADETFQFHEVIAAYGDPSHIRVEEFFDLHGAGPFYKIEIVYTEYGFSIGQRRLHRSKLVLDDRLVFSRIIFYALPYTIDSASMVPWEGFKGFDYYCRNTSNDGNACEP